MNKIFKVIWSKSKQCYIVVSEIAKNKTGKKKIVVAGIFAALAMVGTMQHAQAVDGPGRREGWPSGVAENGYAKYIGTAFDPKKGLVVGPNMGNNDTTRANGNVATVAIGAHSNATGSSSVAIGGAVVNGAGAIGLGWSTANGDNSVALGGTGSTIANGNNAFAASGGNANGESATAIGSSAIADGRGGVAVGWNAESKVNAVGIGFNAKAKANNTIAIGVETNNDKANAISNNYSSVSIGVATRARAVGSMAMGVSADASGKYSIALGSGNVSGDYTATANYPKATGEKAIAIGYDGQALNINATAVGSEAHATGKQSAAYGFKSQASEQDATAIGSNAIASAVRTTALGVNAQALGSNSVAIGGGAGGTGVAGFAEELKADGGDITRLNRNINTATTAEGDNAVALGYYANAANGGVAIGQTSVAATGGVALGQRVLEDTGNKYASAVVIGQDSTAKGTYSVSLGRQTITKGSTSLAMGNGASANGDYSVAMGRKVVADDTSTAIGHHAYASKGGLAIGAQDNDISADRTTASAKGALAIGKNTKASAEDAVAIGTNAQSTLKGAVALGSGSTTATTATKQTSTTVNGIAYNFAGATSDPNMQVSVGAAGKERQIKNVAAGEVSATSTDAINGSQLFAVASQIKPIQYFAVNSSVAGNKDNSGATGSDSVAIGPNAKAQAVSSIALGNNATAAGGNSIAIGNTSSATDKQSPISIGYGATANGDFSVAIGGGDNNTNYGATANGVGGTALGGKTKTTGGNFQTAVGYGATTTAKNASAFGYNATTSVEGGVALGFNSFSTTGVNKGYNPNDNRTNKYDGLKNNVLTSTTGAIAVGNGSTVTRQITGVAAGTNDTDAVNVAQLKSVNLAFKGNVGSGDVNLATNDSDKKLTIQGDRTYIITNASGNTLTISANKKDINVTNGTARADAGVADAKNVAEAINKAVSQNAYNWYLTADNDTAGSRATINKEGTVKFSGDSNITVSRNGNTITTSLNKAITVDSVKANKTITVGTNKITLDGNTGAVTGKAFNGDSFTAGNNVLSNTTLQIGSPTGGNNMSITRDGLTAKAGTKTVKFGTNGINAGDQQINNVASAGGVSTNAANYGDVKNAVSGVTLKINDGKPGSKDSTVNLSDQTLVVKGGTGIQTSVIGQTITVKLDNNTENATTKGIGIKGDSGFATKKYLKDGDAIFNVTGDGNLVKTSSTTTGVQVSVNSAKVKDLAVDAVTVSKATNIPDNPITVTPTAGTNSKDYAIGIDTTKLAAKTKLVYTANGATAKTVSLAKGLNFVNGTNTVSSVDSDGKVSFDLNQATKDSINKSATAVGRTITLNADSGTGSSQSLSNGNVSFAVSGATGDYISTTMDGSAVKVSTKRATINSDANTGAASVTGADGLATAKNVASAINSAVNGLSQNLNISDGTNNSSVALKNQKLTVKGTGAAKATVNGQTITIDVAEGTLSNNADGTVKADAAGVATTKNVADVINKTISDNQYSWKLSANGEATTATVGKGDTVDFTGDTNITVDRNNKDISVKLNKNLTDMNSISLGNARGETIFLNGRDGSIKAGKAEFKDNVGAGSTITSDQLSFTNGATGANESTTTIALDTVAIQSGPNSSILTSKDLTFSDEDGNNAEGSAKGMAFQDAAGKMVHFSLDEIKAGGNKIQEVAEGTADTDAVNVKQLKDTVASQTLTYRANTAADADAKSVKLSKGLDFVDGTSTVATVDNDGKVSFDLNTATKNQINTNTTDITTNKGKIATNTTNIAANTTALARNISLGADTGTASNQSLSTSDVAFNVKGATGDFVSTNMNGNTVEISTKRATINSNATTGEASVTGNDGLATAQNVADAINKAADAAKAGAAWNITTNSSTTDKTAVKGGDTVDLINGDNIEITQDGTDKKKITVATKKDITVDSVTANNKVTVGSGANAITLNGADGSVTGKAFTGTTFTGTSFTAGNTVINTSGLTNGTTAITGTGITTDKLTVGGISVDKTDGINAGGKVISNVASGGTTDSNAANIGDVKQAVANLSQNLNITDGTNNGTIDLKNQKLNVAGANGVTTTVKDQTITVGLDANTVNATTKGIGLTGDTGSTGNKYLKDGDVSFAVTGDGSLVSTTATAAGVKVAVNSASITAGADGTITGPTTDGVATAKNVADAINAAKKASKTEITANTGEAANATTGNMTLTSTTAADGHTIYDVKLNDKVTLGTGSNAVTVDGTTGAITGKTATIGGVTVNGTANTIGGLSNTTWNGTAVSGRAATEDQLKAATGATTLKFTGDVATNTGSVNLKDDTFGIKGDGKYISTDVNGKNVKLTVSEAEVKKSAVAAVTVSTDTTDANNPLTVTPTTSADGTTKDYKVTIDGTKIANKTNLSYKANDGTAKHVSLADGLDFTNGTLTTASIDDNGVVKYDVNTATITAGTDGTITGPTTDGVATAKNVTDAINAAKKASKTEITANTGEAANATTGNMTLTSTTAADGHTIYDVKLNDKLTLGSGTNAVTVDGTAAKVTAGVTTVDGATGTITTGGTNSIKVDGATGTVTGLTNKDWTPGVTKAVTGRAATEDQLQKVADAASSQTWNITADKAGTTGSQTGTKKNATVGKDETVELVAGDNLTINQNERKFTYSLNKDLANLTSVSVGTGTTETIKLDGATGKITAKNAVIGGVTVDGDNNHVTGLSNTTWNGTATTGRAATEDQLKAVAETAKTTTDAVNLKFTGDTNTSPGVVNLKDDTFGIVGDGKYVSTDANGKNLTVKVSEAEVKKSAVAAVTVSTDTTDANNPLTVTPTTSADGTTKDYKVTIDGTKIANKTNLSYKANDGTAKQVSLADGLNFKNGTLTTASIDDAGVVKYDVNTAAITAGADGTITGPTTDGVATAQNVADAINAAKKASKTEITANTGEAANTTTGNVTLTSTTAADGHTIYDVKLNDKVTLGSGANAVTIDGTAGKATIGSSVINGVNNTFTTGGAKAVTLDGATGTITGTTANIGGVTVNGTANTIGGLSNTTWNGTATTGRAATEDQLKAVADAAGSQTWEITADKDAATSGAQTGTKKNAKVGKDDKVQLIAGENLTVNQNERDFTYSLNKDLVKMNSATFLGTGTNTTVITGDSITQTAGTQTNTSTAGGNTVADGTKSTGTTAAGQVIKDGAKSNKSTVDSNVVDDGNGNVNTSNATSNTITDGTNRSTITAGKATIGSSVIDGVNNTFTTGGANAVKLDGAAGTIKTGTVTVTGGTTNDITGLSNTTVTSADFATKGRAATEEQLKAVGEQTWQITADKDATTSGAQTGTKKDAKVGKDDKVQLIAGENMTVNQNERDFTFTLNKDLVKMNSATFLGTGTNTTVITGDSITQTAGTQTNTSTAAGNTVADGTKSTETTADGQVIKDGAKSNKSTVDNNVIDDGNGNVNTSNATSNTITDGTNTTATTSSSVTVKDNAGNSTVITKDNITTGVGGNKITLDGTAGKATVGASVVDGVNNTFTTGGANAVKLDGVAGTIKTGTVTVTGGTTNDITGLSNTTVNSADFATKGRAATEEQLKAVGEQTWQITADKDATTSGAQTGTKKDAKVGKDDKVQLIAGENMTVNQNERDFTFTLNKDLVKMNSATFLGTGTNKTVITGDSITQTAGTQTNTSTAGGNTVADGTKSTETTAAGQVIKDGTKTNTSTVDENTIVDGTKSNKSTVDGNTITDGTNTTATTSSSVTVKDNAGNSTVITKDNITTGVGANKVTLDGTAGKATIGSSVVDGVNNTFTTGGANAVKLDGAAGTIKTGTVTVTGGTTNDITGLSNTTVTAADFATKGRAATEEQLKAVGEQTWQITADKDATTSGAQTGTKKDAKVGKDDKVQLIAGENMTVNQNERDFTFTLNKDLVKMNSAIFEATGGKTTVIKGDSIVQTDGTKVNTSTAGGNTVVDGTKSTATTVDGTTVTSANGNTKYAADGVRINTTGKTLVSLTDAGLDNGNNVIKNVASGHVNNDATDNTNAANIADVKKATTTVTANAGEAANATTGNVTLTSTTAADGHTIYDVKLNDKVTLGSGANAVTIDGTAGKATFGSSVVDGVNNTFTTGGANAVKLDGAAGTIKTGTVTVTGGTTNDITGLSNTTVTAADFATKGRAATEEQLKAVGEQTWQITADKDATTSGAQTGTKKDAKVGKNDKVQLIAGENMTVNQNERDFTFTLNKDLVKMNSATFEATGGKTTVIKGDSIVQTDGTKVNTSTVGGNTVADGTKSTETTADGQVIKDGTKTNTSTVDENTLVDGAKSNKATVDSNVVDDGNGNVNTSNATSNTITDGTNRSTITAGKATIGSSVIDGVNNTFTTGGANAVKLDGAAGTIKTGTVTVTGGTTNDITGLSNTTVTSADFATKGRAATEEQLKAVGEQTWQITADKDATTSGAQTGTKKDAKVGKDDKVQLIAGENMTVNQNERDFTFTLNKDLVKMNSATFEATGGKTTVIKGDSIVQTDGTKTNTATASGNTVADGTKSTETTAVGQVIKDGAKTNTSTVDENTIVDGTKSNKSTVDGNTITDGTNTTATTSSSVTVKDNAGNSTVITKDNITTGVGANKVTLDGTAGKATIGSSIVDGVNNTFTTGGANAVKLDGAAGTIKTGTVTVTGGTTNDITGLSNTTVTSADFATKGRAATEEQLKAVGEQTWQITADKDATTSGAQTGTKKDAKVGKDDKVQLIAGENMTVNQNERDFTFTLNKDLVKMNSATFEATGGKTTVIKGDSIVQTDGTKVNTSTAGGNTVADGTKSTETTAAGQVIKDGAKSNKSTVDNNVIDDGNGNVNTSNATSNTITDGTNTTATTSSSVTVKDNAGNSTVITKDNITTGVGANKVTLDGTAGKATIGSSVVDGVNNTFTTGGANAVKLDGVAGTIKTGTVTVTGGTTNDITGLSNTTVNSADFATKGRAATEEQLKAVGEQTWQITADKDATTSGAQTGTKKDAKVGKDDKVQLIAGENMTVNQNERDFTFTLNKDLVKMNSATFLGTGSNTTVITGNSITQTAGTQTNTSTAAGNTVADGTKSTETTADGQVIKDGAKSNKSTVDSNVIDDGNGNKNISNATSNTITDGTNTSTITAGKANIGNIAVDGVNNKITMGNGATPVTLDGANGHLDGLTNTTWVPGVTKATTGRAATEDQLQQVSDAVGAGWKVNTGTVAGSSGVSNGAASTKVSSGEEVKLQAGDNLVIDQNGKTVSYSLNKDLTKMNSATFEATGGKTTVIKGDSIVQTDGGKTNTSNAAGNTVVDGNKSTATTAAGTTITDGAKTNTSTADKNVINDGAGNTNVSNATSNTLKNAAGDETKSDAKGVTVKDAAGNNATFTKDGITITKSGKDTVSLTSNGLDNGKNKIVNVAAGVANTDAVNVGQLKEYAAKSTTELTANGGQPAGSTTGNIVLTKTTAADGHTIYDNKLNDKITLGTDPTKAVTVDGTTGTVTGLTNKTWTPGSIVSGRAATEDQLKDAVADSGWKAAVDKEGSGQSTVVGTSPEKIKAEETVTFKAGNNMMVTQTGKSISYAVNPELTDMKSATFKDAAGNTTVTNGNGITITPGSANPTNPHAGPVSLTKDGLNNGNNQIKGVAPGTDPTDAVNVSQLNASNANTSQAINQIAGEVQHVGAHAAAMAALKPIQYDPLEPTQVMAGVGNYRGETAAALGLAHYTNENTMFNVGVSVGGNHNMVNAGVTHKFGYSPEKKNIPDRYKAGPISSVYVMQDEVSSLKKENAEQKYVIADQAARLTTLEAENEQQRRELAETKKGLDDLKAAVDKLLASKG